MTATETPTTGDLLNSFLAADTNFATFYQDRAALIPMYATFQGLIDPESILYVWPQVENDELDEDCGQVHVLTPQLFVSATYRAGQPSKAQVRPLNLTGIDITPTYAQSTGATYLARYTLVLHRGTDEPISLMARHSADGFLIGNLQASAARLYSALQSTELGK